MKPTALVADAILDCTKRSKWWIPYLGSGTSILAAEHRSQMFGIEIDPIYVDVAITRWERMTGQKARNSLGQTLKRSDSNEASAHE